MRAATPREAPGPAVDPIALQPVDAVEVTVLVDNFFDGLLTGGERVRRPRLGSGAVVQAAQFEGGATLPGLVAEHGFAALVTVRSGDQSTTVLFDSGQSPDAMARNANALGIGLGDVHSVVLSHGHFDHVGGLAGLTGRRGVRALPMVVHPLIWTRRRLAVPGQDALELPTLSQRALADEGYQVIERREPSLLLDGRVLITGEVDRTTEFERGMPPPHQAWTGTGWQHDPLVLDDQALVVHVRDRGLVVLTGCGHAGAVNIVRHASRLTGVPRLHALIGGLHLSGPAFEPIIPPTVAAFADLAPDLLAPGHCTGWRAQHALAAGQPDAWVQSSSGTTYHLTAA
ncbi:7,8-dihydropterin-6-yl-methyl-4-(beta-D-ribofuranosyl)aminobenzene 5'-phosphate synthase [Labedaea rhizosphaerae]|uniref:7, 8-dihydropterin-6-yl-methyl-4-(Beta-D-ribofuranosyl)aminobenzene 5'-phosphate synthase n=1 Tax=Labedaea rhizosphaerae TaxID=598644 RepID=A0A4R6RXS6_LABRH|nr:7,8-dihydropterin-6-yl-methyl-4-(beta-D-ribofuranosyl)aminobenzene 5'-phosphate synthase [Labedaea rhizosphaerae]